jgi:hypothetical protein
MPNDLSKMRDELGARVRAPDTVLYDVRRSKMEMLERGKLFLRSVIARERP